MRLTGGQAKGITLASPKGNTTRPATDQLREAVFSSLGAEVPGKRCLDLFAGTGAYGLEALSRLAREVIWVENNRQCLKILEKNRTATLRSIEGRGGLKPGLTQISSQSAFSYLANPSGEPYDLIFADPPYAWLEEHLVEFLAKVEPCLSQPRGKLILESPGFLPIDEPRWSCKKSFGRASGDRPYVRVLALA